MFKVDYNAVKFDGENNAQISLAAVERTATCYEIATVRKVGWGYFGAVSLQGRLLVVDSDGLPPARDPGTPICQHSCS